MEKLHPAPYQVADASALLRYEHGLLWSEPGTGKTLTAILVAEQGGYDKVLVICPKIAVGMWAQVYHTQTGKTVYTARKTSQRVWNTIHHHRVVVSTYTAATSDEALRHLGVWIDSRTIVILDEAHYCKSHTAKRAAALIEPVTRIGKVVLPNGDTVEGPIGRRGRLPGVATKAGYILQITGTPITRHPDDLWMQLAHVRNDVLRSYGVDSHTAFTRRYCFTKMVRQGPREVEVTAGPKNLRELEQLLSDCAVVRRKLAEVVEELPARVQTTLVVDMPKSRVEVAEDGEVVIRNLQDSSSPYAKEWHKLGLAKVEAIKELVSEFTRPVLIGFWHKDVAKRAKEIFPKAVVVDGSTPDKTRAEIEQDFNAGRISVLFGQIKAMGVSWNLQGACSDVIMLEQTPSPSDYEQFIARVHRKGQTGHVNVMDVVGTHSLEEAIVRIRQEKFAATMKVLK